MQYYKYEYDKNNNLIKEIVFVDEYNSANDTFGNGADAVWLTDDDIPDSYTKYEY